MVIFLETYQEERMPRGYRCCTSELKRRCTSLLNGPVNGVDDSVTESGLFSAIVDFGSLLEQSRAPIA